jgi:hypothetical protein
MVFHTYRTALSILALIILSACSNGRGSVGEPAAGGEPPPAEPLPPEEPPPEEPPPEVPPPEEPPPEEPPPVPPEPEPPTPLPGAAGLAGYWSGRIVDEDSERERRGIAFVDRSGELQVLAVRDAEPEFVLHGDLCCEASVERDVAARRYLSTREDEAELEASVSNGGLQGRFDFRDREYEFAFEPHPAYLQGLTLDALAGVYTGSAVEQDDAQMMTLTIDPDGTMTGSHSNGCILNGVATIPDPARNMVRLEVELSSCGEAASSRRWNGPYRGLGVLLRDVPSPNDGTIRTDVFHHSLVGPTWLGPFELAR